MDCLLEANDRAELRGERLFLYRNGEVCSVLEKRDSVVVRVGEESTDTLFRPVERWEFISSKEDLSFPGFFADISADGEKDLGSSLSVSVIAVLEKLRINCMSRKKYTSMKSDIDVFRKNWRLKNGKKEVLFSELHSLLTSGLDFGRSFRLLIDGETDKRVKVLLEELYASVIIGHSLWESFVASGKFSPLDSGVLRIGEETGRVDESLRFLADYYRKREEQRRMITGAVSYPLIILSTAMLVLVFMILVIVPMFEQVYARMGGELPAITRWIISLSGNFPVYLLTFWVFWLRGDSFLFSG